MTATVANAALGKRQKYDYRDTDRRELKLISVGHAIWRLYLREVRANGSTGRESEALLGACQTIWDIKKQIRKDLQAERTEKFAQMKHRFTR